MRLRVGPSVDSDAAMGECDYVSEICAEHGPGYATSYISHILTFLEGSDKKLFEALRDHLMEHRLELMPGKYKSPKTYKQAVASC